MKSTAPQSIQQLIGDHITTGGDTRLHTINTAAPSTPEKLVRGVLFGDSRGFIAWRDLGYNPRIRNNDDGFYSIAKRPRTVNSSFYATWKILPVQMAGNSEMFMLSDGEGTSYVLGEEWQVAELLPVLINFLADVDDNNSPPTTPAWLTTGEACEFAHEYDPTKFPLKHGGRSKLADRIRQAARRESLTGWTQNETNKQYKFNRDLFLEWLKRTP